MPPADAPPGREGAAIPAPGRRLRIALALVVTLVSAEAPALSDDRLQAIEITAERAERNERKGYTVYSGAVVLTQGSLRIEADRLTIYHDREAADRIIASGEPAHLRQRPAPDKPFVVAQGERIVYERSREVVTLRGAASIEQEGAVVTGESIRYFMAEQVVRADARPEDESTRVQVFIPADVVEAASSDDEVPSAPRDDDAAAGAGKPDKQDKQDTDSVPAATPTGDDAADDGAVKAGPEGHGERGATRGS